MYRNILKQCNATHVAKSDAKSDGKRREEQGKCAINAKSSDTEKKNKQPCYPERERESPG